MGQSDPFICIPAYKLVKDHRTNAETGNVQAVMDGGLEMFVEAYLRSQQKKL